MKGDYIIEIRREPYHAPYRWEFVAFADEIDEIRGVVVPNLDIYGPDNVRVLCEKSKRITRLTSALPDELNNMFTNNQHAAAGRESRGTL